MEVTGGAPGLAGGRAGGSLRGLGLWADEREHPLLDELAELRRQTLHAIAGTALAANFLLLLGVGWFDMDLGRADVWVVTASLSGLTLGAVALARRAHGPAAALLLAGLLGSVATAATVYGWGQVVYALPLAVFVAPLLIGRWGTLATTLASLALIRAVADSGAVRLEAGDVLAASLFVGGSAVLTWIAYRPMRTMLGWSWAGYLEQAARTREVQERQGELAGLSKALGEAVERLELANAALAQARRTADEARRLKDEFATSISHELRTPLNLIVGFTELVRGALAAPGEPSPEALREDVETIHRNACHLSDLVDDVLDLGRLDAHRLALQKDWAALPEVARAAAEAVAGLYAKAGLTIALALPDDLPRLYLDATRVRQVLINLLTNAVRYTEEGGVEISAGRDGHDVVVAVRDSGIGIAPDDLPHVFESFRQPGQTSRRGGFGLGLTISKRFVEMHGGAIWVESQPGQGSTFRFTLPVTDNVAAMPPEPNWHAIEGPGARARQRTVLVLDREVEAARIFGRYLDEHRIVAATTPEEVLRATRSAAVGAIVVASPELGDDDELLRAARRGLPRVPILRCPLRTVGRAGRELGAAAFLTKPVTREQLRDALRRLGLRPRRVLVVDDDADMVRLLTRMLHAILPKSQVASATDGLTGLALARSDPADGHGGPPDLILLDLLMPTLDGHAFLRELHADPRLAAVPVVIVSAASEEDHDLVTGDALEVRREGGLSVADLMRAVRGTLDALLPPTDKDPARGYTRRQVADHGR
jgi:signal transduction histidine kinase/CheY-like chemotaxis protein